MREKRNDGRLRKLKCSMKKKVKERQCGIKGTKKRNHTKERFKEKERVSDREQSHLV